MSYGSGVKMGGFINSYLYRDEPKMSREERKQIRQDNAQIVLYGRDAFEQSEREKKSKGGWD